MKVAIGLMSGTSMDGVDAALLRTDGEAVIEQVADVSIQYPREFYFLIRGAELAVRNAEGDCTHAGTMFEGALQELLDSQGDSEKRLQNLQLWYESQNVGLEFSFEGIIALSSDFHAEAVDELLSASGIRAADIDVIGYHGQTLFHRPAKGITVQAGDGKRLARATGIPVVNDFRSNDVSNGGQGAPFAPVYHRALAAQFDLLPAVVVNCGGITNPTIMPREESCLCAFDTGPGNALLDRFVAQRTGGKMVMDRDGKFGARGEVDQDVLEALFASAVMTPEGENYFSLPIPKSLDAQDCQLIPELEPLSLEDGCRTLEAFTAEAIVRGLDSVEQTHCCEIPQRWILAGGGWQNPVIAQEFIRRLSTRLGEQCEIKHASEVSWRSEALEAQIFAYLAVRHLKNLPLSYPGTTGVPSPTRGGCLHTP